MTADRTDSSGSRSISTEETAERSDATCRPACPVCGGGLVNIRQKLQCTQCHTIVETCCEGGRG